MLHRDIPPGRSPRLVARRGPHVPARGSDRGGGAAGLRRVQEAPHRAAGGLATQPLRVQLAGQSRQRGGEYAA